MQNWYSQNNPFRSKGVGAGYGVGMGFAVAVGMADSVAATACWISVFGLAFGAQAVTIKISSINGLYRMHLIIQFFGTNPVMASLYNQGV